MCHRFYMKTITIPVVVLIFIYQLFKLRISIIQNNRLQFQLSLKHNELKRKMNHYEIVEINHISMMIIVMNSTPFQ